MADRMDGRMTAVNLKSIRSESEANPTSLPVQYAVNHREPRTHVRLSTEMSHDFGLMGRATAQTPGGNGLVST